MADAIKFKLEEKDYRLDPDDPRIKAALSVPYNPNRRARQAHRFVLVPWDWVTKLDGASGQTYRLALVLLHLHWKDNGRPITLANCTVEGDGIPPQTKRHVLRVLERRGLVKVDWRQRKSSIVRVLTG